MPGKTFYTDKQINLRKIYAAVGQCPGNFVHIFPKLFLVFILNYENFKGRDKGRK